MLLDVLVRACMCYVSTCSDAANAIPMFSVSSSCPSKFHAHGELITEVLVENANGTLSTYTADALLHDASLRKLIPGVDVKFRPIPHWVSGARYSIEFHEHI